MMKRLVSWLFFIGLGLTVLLLVLPGMIDWSRHKDLLINELSARLGQDIRIDGDVELRLLPNPHVNLEKVVIGSADKNRYLVSLQSLDARMSMDKLLKGQFVIDRIHLQEPVVNIFVDQNGSNWRDFWAARAKKQDASGQMVALQQVTVSRASISYTNQVTGQQWAVPRVNMTLTADSVYGPYQARGDADYGVAPLTFTFATQPRDAQGGLPFVLDVTPIENLPETKITGVFSPLESVPLTMAVDARNGATASLFSPFGDLATVTAMVPALKGKGQAVFGLEVVADGVRFKNIKASDMSGATLAGDAVYHASRGMMDADMTVTRPGLYWLSYDGAIDLVRKKNQGKSSWKIEDASKLVAHAPAVSIEASGDLDFTSQDSWTLSHAHIRFPDWQGAAFSGQVQRVNGQTAFSLTAPQVGIVTDLSLNGQMSQTLAADGTASVFGQTVPVMLSGAPAKPDIDLTLPSVNSQEVLSALNAAATGVNVTGGSLAFKGQIDMQAPLLTQVLTGTLSLNPQSLKIAAFSPAALQAKILALQTVPGDLASQLKAALASGEGSFAAKPVSLTLPLVDTAWHMKNLAYDGGSFDFGTAGGEASVIVTASDDTKVSYKGTLPLGEKNMPVEQAEKVILERHPPAPDVDTKAAIGDILDRLDDGHAADAQMDTPPDASSTEDVVIKPPQETSAEPSMPPQPAPPLEEIEVAPPPALPEDTPLAVDIPPSSDVVDGTQTDIAPDIIDDVPDEIFPLEAQ